MRLPTVPGAPRYRPGHTSQRLEFQGAFFRAEFANDECLQPRPLLASFATVASPPIRSAAGQVIGRFPPVRVPPRIAELPGASLPPGRPRLALIGLSSMRQPGSRFPD